MTSVGHVLAVISASLLHCSFAATGEAIMTVKLLKPIYLVTVVSWHTVVRHM